MVRFTMGEVKKELIAYLVIEAQEKHKYVCRTYEWRGRLAYSNARLGLP